jgi:hypothetical protein
MRSVVFFCVASVCDALLASIRPAKYGKVQLLQVKDDNAKECTASSSVLDVAYGVCTCSGWSGLRNALLAVPKTVFEVSVGCSDQSVSTCASTPAKANSCKAETHVAIAAITSCTSTVTISATTTTHTYYFPGITCVEQAAAVSQPTGSYAQSSQVSQPAELA